MGSGWTAPLLSRGGMLDVLINNLNKNYISTLDTTKDLLSQETTEKIFSALKDITALTRLKIKLEDTFVEPLREILKSNKNLEILDVSDSTITVAAALKLSEFIKSHTSIKTYYDPNGTKHSSAQESSKKQENPESNLNLMLRLLVGATIGQFTGAAMLSALQFSAKLPQDWKHGAEIILATTLAGIGLSYLTSPARER